MIRTLFTGVLYADPQARTSAAGKFFTTAKVRADGKDGESIWISLVAFGELGDKLATLKPKAKPKQPAPVAPAFDDALAF